MDNLLIPSTFNKLGLLTLKGWIGLGSILSAIFLQMHNSEPSSDFRCYVKGNIDKDFVRGKCFDQYQQQNNKLGVPLYAFIMVNVLVIPVLSVIYSQYVKSTVTELERHHQDAERGRSRRLFLAYFCQLAVSCALRIIFIAFLEIELFYPRAFPADFYCSIKATWVGFLLTQIKPTMPVHCFTQRARDKNFWTGTVEMANGIFAFFAFLEILWILSRARNGMKFMDNWQFYADHLKSHSDEQRQRQPDGIPLVESQHGAVNIPHELRNDEMTNSSEHEEHAQAQSDFHSAIQTLKRNCLQDTEELSDFKHPFGEPNPGEGHIHDLTIDKIYVHVVIVEGRAYHEFAQDRWEQLQEYPPDAKDCKFAKPEDILDENHRNVLVVGRPGIGKTSLSIKLLRLWASGEAFNGDEKFNVVFLLKFRRFNNDNANLSLRDLMACSETVHSLDDAVWDFIKQEPTKVLLIFDGLDEYSRKEDIKAQKGDLTCKNCVEEKMPLSVLYNKLVGGKLLRGASILTTTRPTAVECVRHVGFQRTVEIRGFTSDNVKEYVKNFTRGNLDAMEKMWEHIKSNINLFSFCYIPMNCFLICHCLLQIILSESSQALPTKMTDIYKMTVKMFLFNHNREGFSPEELARLKSTHMDEPFDKLPEELKKIFNSLGEIAFKGIDERRLLFESSEVSDMEDCGLLHKLPDLKRKALDDPSKSQFCFTHLTVQEFFAAKHLVDTETDEGIERFVCNHINDGTWQVVLQFAAGLLKSSLSSHIFIKLLPEPTQKKANPLSSQPKTVTTWPATKDKHLAVQVCKCLYEINDEQQPVLQNKIEEIKFNAVELSHCSLAPIDVAAVLHFLENAEEVLYINLRGNSLGDLGANEVKKFLVNRERKLQQLNLCDCNLTDNAAKDFAAALEHSNCKLELLSLNGSHFSDNTAKDFAAALKHSNCKLEMLYLSNNNFTDDVAKDFAAALKHSNCTLESLFLGYNNFTDNAAKDFAAAVKHSNCKLESLDLSYNEFTDNAAKDFAAALVEHSNCKLESLYLSSNRFTDNAAKYFAAALEHSNCKLKSLTLSGINFTEEGRKYLTDVGKQSNCKILI
ncbi:NACHT, LRR and PYD domains-containing protein 3-like [Acropora millepora]|uniref:NACHT, LRR and PYD domains-containing protein 3-like n=1 Tax=Acropora millepora TaxID=45264 RepID=UPI001CF4648E|nr:NACHT, LRR and PYD domains-containing protein 3-like [Acropora millepora]